MGISVNLEATRQKTLAMKNRNKRKNVLVAVVKVRPKEEMN